MANISDALGKLTLEGTWTDEQIRALIYLLKSQDMHSDYSIFLSDDYDDIYASLKYNYLSFSATGRWTFNYNLECLHNWSLINEEIWNNCCMRDFNKKISYEEYLMLRTWLIKEMFVHDLSLKWEFVDMDPGLNWLNEYVCINKVEHVGVELVITYSQIDCIVHDYNLKTFCEYYDNGDDEALVECVCNLIDLYNHDCKDVELIEYLCSTIENHVTWYDIPPYPYYETKEDIPEKLRNMLDAVFKVTHENK